MLDRARKEAPRTVRSRRALVLAMGLALACCAGPAHAPSRATPAPAPDAAPVIMIDAAPPADAALADDPAALAARDVALYQQVAAALEAAGPCDAQARAIDALTAEAAPVIAARRAARAGGRAADYDAALDRAQLAAAVDRIARALTPCRADADLERALDRALAP